MKKTKRKAKRAFGGKTHVTWTTADGKSLPVSKMTDLHLLNATAMMLRNASNYRMGIELLIPEADTDGSLSDSEILALYHPQFVAMADELELRGLRRRLAQAEGRRE